MRVLIIGLGSIAKKHIAAIYAIDATSEIFALRSNKNATDIDGVKSIYSLDEIPNDLDFALIANPSNKHLDTVKSLIPFSCPLIIEKPSVHTLEGADEVLAEIEAKGIKNYVACNLRFHACLQYIKEQLVDLKINEVNVYAGSYLPDWRPGQDYRKTYSALKDLGGGVHMDLVHEIDYVYWLFGAPESYTKTLRSVSTLAIDAIDYANYNLVYPKFCANIVLNYYRKTTKRELEIVSDDSIWTVNILENKVYKDGEEVFSSDKTVIDTYQSQIEHFLAYCKDEHESVNTFKESLEVMKICVDD